LPVFIEKIYSRCMPHKISGFRVGLLPHIKSAEGIGDLFNLVRRARKSREAFVEIGDVTLERLGVVPLRVYGDEEHLEFILVGFAHLFGYPVQDGKRNGADVRAVRIAEEEKYRLPPEVAQAHLIAV